MMQSGIKQKIYYVDSKGKKNWAIIVGKDEYDIERKFWDQTQLNADKIISRENIVITNARS